MKHFTSVLSDPRAHGTCEKKKLKQMKYIIENIFNKYLLDLTPSCFKYYNLNWYVGFGCFNFAIFFAGFFT